MTCPACGRTGTVQWTPPTYACCSCGHVLTKREYERAIRGGEPLDDEVRIAELEAEVERLREAIRELGIIANDDGSQWCQWCATDVTEFQHDRDCIYCAALEPRPTEE